MAKIIYPKEGLCPFCQERLKLDKEERHGKVPVHCPLCDASYPVEKVTFEKTTKSTSTDVEDEKDSDPFTKSTFRSLLSTYKIYIVLTIFLDFFFIFTILCFSQRSKLIKLSRKPIPLELKISYKNWNTAFIIILIAKAVLIIYGIFLS